MSETNTYAEIRIADHAAAREQGRLEASHEATLERSHKKGKRELFRAVDTAVGAACGSLDDLVARLFV